MQLQSTKGGVFDLYDDRIAKTKVEYKIDKRYTNKHSKNTMSWLRYLYLYEWQSATPYSDPNNICSAGATGYRAISDCTGYVYCNNGYLMGGGSEYELINSVMPCPNAQLFDDSVQACSSTMTKCSTSGGVEEKPKTRSPSNRPTNKPMAQISNTSRPRPPAPRSSSANTAKYK